MDEITSWKSHVGGTKVLMTYIQERPENDEFMKALAKEMTNEDWEACRIEVVFLEQLFKYKK